ncbi:MAG: hypothetical protein U5L45_04455 [Saprospiraceae bacterium]|nr:hypothetical protein [Saprospiraceae bacterium]
MGGNLVHFSGKARKMNHSFSFFRERSEGDSVITKFKTIKNSKENINFSKIQFTD